MFGRRPSRLALTHISSLSVCLFVRTTKRRTIKVGGQVHCTKISLEFECRGQRSKVKVTRDKKRKTAESSPSTMHSRACAVAIGRTQHAARSNRRCHCVPPGVTGYAGGKIRACCLFIAGNCSQRFSAGCSHCAATTTSCY